MTDTNATTNKGLESEAQANEPVADPLPWLLRNTLQRRARSADGAQERVSKDDAERRGEGDCRRC